MSHYLIFGQASSLMKTKTFKNFLGLHKQAFDGELKKSWGNDNLIVFAGADKLKHAGITGPYSLKYNFSGKTYYELEQARLAISPNNYLFINDGQFYTCETEAGNAVRSLIIFFATDFLPGPCVPIFFLARTLSITRIFTQGRKSTFFSASIRQRQKPLGCCGQWPRLSRSIGTPFILMIYCFG